MWIVKISLLGLFDFELIVSVFEKVNKTFEIIQNLTKP